VGRFVLSLDLVGGYGHLPDLTLLQERDELAVGNGRNGVRGSDVILEKDHKPDAQQDVPDGKLVMFLQFFTSSV
jgi:hypothetical protein